MGVFLRDLYEPIANLRVHLEARGISQEEAAAKIGISRGSLGQYLAGKRRPTLDWLVRIAGKLEIDPHDLDPRLASSRPRSRSRRRT